MRRFKRPVAISIDSGLDMGWALWDLTGGKVSLLRAGYCLGICNVEERAKLEKEDDIWIVRFRSMLEKFENKCDVGDFDVRWIGCEIPGYREDATGKRCAKTGSLVKLAATVGAFIAMAYALDADFRTATVSEWKGQWPKWKVCDKISSILGSKKCDELLSPRKPIGKSGHSEGSHDWDAVGVGLWLFGVL